MHTGFDLKDETQFTIHTTVPKVAQHANRGEPKRVSQARKSAASHSTAHTAHWPHIQRKHFRSNGEHDSKDSRVTGTCFRCLSPSHWVRECSNKIRCRYCFIYGHVERYCYKKRRENLSFWRAKAKTRDTGQAHKAHDEAEYEGNANIEQNQQQREQNADQEERQMDSNQSIVAGDSSSKKKTLHASRFG